jgi:hypothetical protein
MPNKLEVGEAHLHDLRPHFSMHEQVHSLARWLQMTVASEDDTVFGIAASLCTERVPGLSSVACRVRSNPSPVVRPGWTAQQPDLDTGGREDAAM